MQERELTLSKEAEVTDEQVEFQASEKEIAVVTDAFHRFRRTRDQRNRNLAYFDGINLTTYINDSVRRFTTNIDERDGIEDWQARVHDPFTRNKVLTILGKIMAVLPIAQFKGRGDEDIRKGTILTNLYEYSEDLDDYEEFMTHVLLEAIVKGTSIAYEGVNIETRKIREVKGAGDNIKVENITEKKTQLFGQLVPLEEFYPASIGIRTMSKQPYCFWRKVVTFSKFKEDWRAFKKAALVQPKQRHNESEDRQFYDDYISDDVNEGNVEIIRYYSRKDDEYIVIANGIWINPVFTGKSKKEVISPLPFTHKELPFWDVKFDFFGDFFYGKSLPDRLKSMQDVLNVLTNMLLDQSFLTIFPPLLTNGFDSIEDDYLRPGRRTPVDTQGLPINQAFMSLDMGTPSSWHQFILEYTRNIMEQSSVDQIQSGQAGVGDRTTAQEIRVAAEGVASILGIFGRLISTGIKRKAALRGANILQYWTQKGSPVIQRIGGSTGNQDFNAAFNVFKIDNTTLTDGRRGTKIIELFGNKSDLPNKEDVTARQTLAEVDAGKPVEIAAMPGNYIRDFAFDVEIVPDIKKQSTKEADRALQLEKVRVYMSFFPNQVNVAELAAETAEVMGDDPTKILTDDVFKTAQGQGIDTETESPLSTNPTQNIANNQVRSLAADQT